MTSIKSYRNDQGGFFGRPLPSQAPANNCSESYCRPGRIKHHSDSWALTL